jgi:uncharacterized cupredoxin-like copper-binding protein
MPLAVSGWSIAMAKQPHEIGRTLVATVLLWLLAGCTHAVPQSAGLDVTLKDFEITPSQQTVAAGNVVIRVHNDAEVTHQFIVVRSDLPADGLPVGRDGLSVNEEWLTAMGGLDEVPEAQTGALQLDLQPGRYVFFCNLEGHYLGGMHAVLEVTDA